jgi:hypothetical protein
MMRFGRIFLSSTILIALVAPALALSHARRGPTAPKMSNKRVKGAQKRLSQIQIEPQRATEIQLALIKSGYLSGEPSGTWDAPTQSAMQKLQADNGWQTKLVPDSRAIIKLGLGPAQDDMALSHPAVEETSSPSASNY